MLEATMSLRCSECLRVRDTHLNAILQDWSMASVSILCESPLPLSQLRLIVKFSQSGPSEDGRCRLRRSVACSLYASLYVLQYDFTALKNVISDSGIGLPLGQ